MLLRYRSPWCLPTRACLIAYLSTSLAPLKVSFSVRLSVWCVFLPFVLCLRRYLPLVLSLSLSLPLSLSLSASLLLSLCPRFFVALILFFCQTPRPCVSSVRCTTLCVCAPYRPKRTLDTHGCAPYRPNLVVDSNHQIKHWCGVNCVP